MDVEQSEIIVWIAIGALTAIQMVYLFAVYNAVHRRKKDERKGNIMLTEDKPGISIVMVASDHEELLAENLPHILTQDYPDYEVIVVDDNSQDDTKDLLQRLALKHQHLYSTFTSDSIRYISRKKLALTLGIKAAKKEWLVFIEPDCRPASNQWLALMARHFTENTDVVLGYSNYVRRGGLANLCYMYDTLVQQVGMLGLTLHGLGYMGIGRNMAYRKEIFFNSKGYSRHLDLERGEDDLFINEHVKGSRMTAEVSAEATVRCEVANTHKWTSDKLNRIFVRRKMQGAGPYLTDLDTLSRSLYLLGVVGGIIYSCVCGWWITLIVCASLWTIWWATRLVIFHFLAKDLGERKYNVSLPLMDLMQPCWELYFRLRLMVTSKRAFLRSKI